MNMSFINVLFREPSRTTDNLMLKYRICIKKYSWQYVIKENKKHI